MLTSSGAQVFPGDVLFRQEGIVSDITAVRGCKLVLRNGKRSRAEEDDKVHVGSASVGSSSLLETKKEGAEAMVVNTVIIATVVGRVQYEDGSISVIPSAATASGSASGSNNKSVTPSTDAKVLLRVQRVSRQNVQGTIIAIVNNATAAPTTTTATTAAAAASSVGTTSSGAAQTPAASSSSNTSWCYIGGSGGFRGTIRCEDIRPVVNKNDVDAKLIASFPASSVTASGAIILPAYASFRPGDIVAAAVSSQTDTKQFQLSTMPEDTGCISSASLKDKGVQLVAIPGRRDAMLNPKSGETESKWCPK